VKLIDKNEQQLNLETSNYEMSVLLREIQTSLKGWILGFLKKDREVLIKKIQKTLDRATF
jgi:hypothetical protein|tara:strand:+ start:481 stop:660 length:180 start_codon:yes stop_codon:yes gene_type:complete